jgi:hypothetical protein
MTSSRVLLLSLSAWSAGCTADGDTQDAGIEADPQVRAISRLEPELMEAQAGIPLTISVIHVNSGAQCDTGACCPQFDHIEVERLGDRLRLTAYERLIERVCGGAIFEEEVSFALPALPAGEYTVEAETLDPQVSVRRRLVVQ